MWRLCVTFLLVFSALSAKAQVRVIVRGGLSISKPASTLIDAPEFFSLGHHVGVGMRLPLHRKWQLSLQPEWNQTQKGAKGVTFLMGSFGPDWVARHQILQTEFPVLLRKDVGRGNLRFYLEAGPSLWGRIHADKVTLYYQGRKAAGDINGKTGEEYAAEMNQSMARRERAWNLGAGLSFRHRRHEISLGSRYNLATTNLLTWPSLQPLKNRVRLLNVGYAIAISN